MRPTGNGVRYGSARPSIPDILEPWRIRRQVPSAELRACCSALSGVHSRIEPLGSPAAKCYPGQNSSCPRRSWPCASEGPPRMGKRPFSRYAPDSAGGAGSRRASWSAARSCPRFRERFEPPRKGSLAGMTPSFSCKFHFVFDLPLDVGCPGACARCAKAASTMPSASPTIVMKKSAGMIQLPCCCPLRHYSDKGVAVEFGKLRWPLGLTGYPKIAGAARAAPVFLDHCDAVVAASASSTTRCTNCSLATTGFDITKG
jgi:hypothetical protein